jgi:hypothetical protein
MIKLFKRKKLTFEQTMVLTFLDFHVKYPLGQIHAIADLIKIKTDVAYDTIIKMREVAETNDFSVFKNKFVEPCMEIYFSSNKEVEINQLIIKTFV